LDISYQQKLQRNLADIAKNYTVWMVILWGIFLASYGIYLFVLFLTIGKTEKPKN
jgi:hypothetical protein